MSFLSKFKGGASTSTPANASSAGKKDPHTTPATPLEKHLRDVAGPLRTDGSDKFFGFENYGSTCYSNSIVQCLYYSAPFRSHVINFPPSEYLPKPPSANDRPVAPRSTSAIPWPNLTSPARKVPPVPGTPAAAGQKEETKDSPEYRKRMALQAGPVLDMIHDNSNRYGMEESLFTGLKDIFEAILTNSSRMGVVSPHKFLEILRRENEMFRSAMHQDAHEFLNLLLNEVVENVEAFSKQHPPINGVAHANGAPVENGLARKETATNGIDTRWVHDLFEGLLTSETRCLTCENTSQRDEPFLDLSVDLAAHTSVTSCLRKFSAEEMLCERNKFHCDNCGGLQEAEKRMKIKRLPRVLALHLKRFKYTEDLQRLQKLFHRVVYPFYLRLFNTSDDAEDPDRLYELYAVVVHIGGGPYHGHYVSIIKTQDRGWLLFDDELVEPVDKSYVLNFFGGEPIPGLQDAKQLACAYVLFYQETTLEAMLKEQEMEGQKPVPTRTSEGEVAKDVGLNNLRNGVTAHPPAVATPIIPDETDGLESLAHAVTMPSVAAPAVQAPLEPTQTTPAEGLAATNKSWKERRLEAKEKKAAAKAAEKELDEKRKEASAKRVEAWKKADAELKSAIEASKMSAVDEASKRGDEVPKGLAENTAPPGGGLSRFRTTSLNLKNKPKFLSGKDRGPASMEKLPSVRQEVGGQQAVDGNGVADAGELSPATTPEMKSPPVTTPMSPDSARSPMSPDSASKRYRFSIRKKESQGVT
ncbi:hypothetical protein BDY17DRAFT_298121 [Neohortaea acidophila]|uniref:ubiquitinyl hydrolase 1 n=1 Tax=Neohortaea acidophila TaxID=245834 RepID=A0A6A6PQ33_9PEZI|nr:uncharacterized protein BDY17DRAFT_298121 [Neohortaea acidophila]KAF2482209.1 hypothetical protein BDY17DRAFT_298121 [Neohortaea acidophila]